MPESPPRNHGLLRFDPAIFGGVMIGLFLLRFFIVAESAAQGETLWIVGLWLLAGAVYAVSSVWHSPIRLNVFDACVALLVGGHILSALVVLWTTGDQRNAVNLGWEWVGIAVAWSLLRQECRHSQFRLELLAGLLATGTAIAGFGVYQHYIEFPQMVSRYGPLFDQLKYSTNPAEVAQARKTLIEDQIPVEGAGFTLFEKRLRDSREPYAFFALANTFGGFLAVSFLLAVTTAAAVLQFKDQRTWLQWSLWTVAIAIIGWCLLLTKSRTAWIGTAMGLAGWSLATASLKISSRWLIKAVGGLVVLALIAAGLARVGGLDRQVLTEAPKSLQYRLQYWAATWPMILEHPWFGVGPGQFRSYYVLYKLPEASEEIADPHNIFLDVAVSGGLLAVVGLLGCCLFLVIRFHRAAAAPPSPARLRLSSGSVYGILGVTVVMCFAQYASGEDDRSLILAPIAFALYFLLRRILSHGQIEQSSLQVAGFSAVATLILHLCGAGGIEMPVIALLLLALIAWSDIAAGDSRELHFRSSSKLRWIIAGLCLGLVVALTVTGIVPTRSARDWIAAGDKAMSNGNQTEADKDYAMAAEANPRQFEPWLRRADLAYLTAKQTWQTRELFETAVTYLKEAMRRNPLDSHLDHQLGQWWMARWRATGHESKDAEAAVAALERACHRNPTNAQLMADLAVAYQAARQTDSAKDSARRALNQDLINHQRGHEDRYLSVTTSEMLQQLLSDTEIP